MSKTMTDPTMQTEVGKLALYDDVKKVLKDIEVPGRETVMFISKKTSTAFGPNDIFTFNSVTFNADNCFSKTGYFTAPSTGLYVFHFNGVSNYPTVYIKVMKRSGPGASETIVNTMIDKASSGSYISRSDLRSISHIAVIHLTKSEQIFLVITTGSIYANDEVQFQFFGYKII